MANHPISSYNIFIHTGSLSRLVEGDTMTVTTENPTQRRGRGFEPQGPDGYHVGWYPVCLSEEIDAGGLAGTEFLNGRVVAFRDPEGNPVVMSAYCRHLGADLGIGDVVDGCVRCAFHHWTYAADGKCVSVPVEDPIPEDARLYVFPAAERFGVVFAYNGDDEPSELPHFDGYDHEQLYFKPGPRDSMREYPVEPWVLLTNSCDIQHLRALHGLEIDVDVEGIDIGERHVEYDAHIVDPNLGEMDQHIKTFGTNTIMLTGRMAGMEVYMGSSAVPLPNGTSRNFQFAATPKGDGSEGEREQADAALTMALAFGEQLLKDDDRVMSTVHFREDLLLPADRALTRFLRYVRAFPRSNPARDFLS
jgi:phenylpropionate dioxygenase-like ring-hydroxylating dioxygenase large terminal subunit